MSIFDQARNFLKDLQGKATSVGNYFNPPVRSPISKPIQKLPQGGIDFGAMARNAGNAFMQNQKLAPWGQQLPQVFPKVNIPQINTRGSGVNFVGNNLVKPLAESVLNTPYNLVKGSNLINQGLNTRQTKPLLQGVGHVGEAALNILPFGKGVSAAKTLVKPTIMQGIKQGAKIGAGYGGAYGLSSGLQADKLDPMELLKQTATGIGIGGAFGGGAGAIGGVVGKFIDKTTRDRFGKYATPAQRKQVEEETYRRLSTPIKTMEIDPATGQRKTLPMWQYEMQKKGAGLSIQDINKLSKKDYAKLKGKNNIREQLVEKTGRRLSPLVETSTVQTKQSTGTLKSLEGLPESGAPPQNPTSGGIVPPESDPVNKIIQALREAKPIRGAQEALYSADRARRVAKATAMGQKIKGEKGFYAQLGSLKGEMQKVQFEGIRSKLTSEDINSVFQKVEDVPYFSTFEKITAKGGLAKLLGKEGGAVPNKSELALLNEVFPPEFIKAAQGNKTLLQKVVGTIGDIAAVPRSLMAGGFDMSYGLRQGVFSGYRHPKQWASAFKDQVKFFTSEKALQQSSMNIKAHPNYKLAREAGLSITDLGSGRLNPREEQFQSVLAEKIPGIGKFVRASGRAYTGFANKYRFDMFNDLVTQAKKTGDFKDPKFLKSAGELVNTLTGRGHLGPFERAGGVLSTTLFSPRLLASRLQLMNPQFYMKLQPLARKRALESLVAYLAGTATVLGAAKLAGADVSTNMTSSDFAKIKVGNTRIDIMGGFQQPMVLLARLLTGKVTSSTSGKTMTLGEGYKPMTRFDIVQRFFESKEAPIISFISSAFKGEDNIGNKFNLPTETINRMVPMFIGDMVDLYKDGGLSALPLGIGAFFGTGAQTYGKTEMVTGKNQLGQPTAQIRPIQGLGETITEKVFGRGSLGTSSRTNAEQYYDQMLKMPKDEASTQFRTIIKSNPDLAKQIMQVAKDRRMGVTVNDQVLKAKGVASGDRAKAIADEMNKLKTPEEKSALFRHYMIIKVITPEVSKQLNILLRQ